jgi:uncharacterized RDD family membrane protein YckC
MTDAPTRPADDRFYSAQARKRFYLAGMALLLAGIAMHFLLTNRLRETLKEKPARAVWFEYADGEAAVRWRGDFWFPAVAISEITQWPSSASRRQLVRMTETGPEEICGLGEGRTWLMPREEALWIFSSDGVSSYDGESLNRVQAARPPPSDGPPVLWEEKPTFITRAGKDVSVRALEEKEWREVAAFQLQPADDKPPPELRMAVVGDRPVIFLREGDGLYAHDGFPSGAVDLAKGWEKIGKADGPWAATVHSGKACVLTFRLAEKQSGGEIVLHAREANGWTDSDLQAVNVPLSSMGVSSDGKLHIIYQSVPWALNTLTVEGASVADTRRYGRFFKLSDPEVRLFLLGEAGAYLLVFLQLFGFWALTTSCRPPFYTLMGPPVVLASLPRRAAALAVDLAILFGPFGAGMLVMWNAFSTFEIKPPGVVAVLATPLVLGGLAWAAIGALLFCLAVGRYGRTPGKWMLGIRVVGMELRPCGFWRALLRTICLVPDSWLNFLVGIGLIAYSRHWQRLGDLFARTVVIRDMPQPTDLARIQSTDATL